MIDKFFKLSVIVIACFLVIICIVFFFTNYNVGLIAQNQTENKATNVLAVPESHVWEVVSTNNSGILFNKKTGEAFYLSTTSFRKFKFKED